MALLIHNQAAFVEQIARNDQERLVLQRKSDEHELKFDAWRGEVDEWRRKSDERFERIEAELQICQKRLSKQFSISCHGSERKSGSSIRPSEALGIGKENAWQLLATHFFVGRN